MKKTLTLGTLGVACVFLVSLPPLLAQEESPSSPEGASPDTRSTTGIAWGDADGDGRRDAFLIDAQGRGVLLLQREGDGLVAEPTGPLSADRPLARASWRDLDGDGRDELLLLPRSGSGRLLRFDPAVGFEDVTGEFGLRLLDARSAEWIDVDSSGTPDLVTESRGATQLHTLRNGRFETQSLGVTSLAAPAIAPSAASASEQGAEAAEAPGAFDGAGELESTGARRPLGSGPVRGDGAGSPDGGPTTGDVTPLRLGPPTCAQTLRDQTRGTCLEATSVPAIGNLYPLSVDFNVDEVDGRVGIGTTRATARLTVNSSGAEDAAHFVDGTLGVGVDVLSSFIPRAELALGADSAGRLALSRAGSATTAELLAAESAGDGGALKLWNTSGVQTAELDGDVANGSAELLLRRSDGTNAIWLESQDTGSAGSQLSMRTSNGFTTARITSEEGAGNGAQLDLGLSDGTQTIVLDAEIGSNAAELSLFNRDGVETFEVYSQEGAGNGSQLRMASAAGVTTVLLDAETSDAAEFSLFTSDGTETVEIVSEEVSGDGAQIVLRKGDGTASIVLDAEQGATGRITTEVLEITGGADLVESFETGGDSCEPGSVVVIDADRPGELKLSRTAYDSRVAGIVSGAGDVRPGLRMGQTGVASGDTPVALTGRVYVKACIENGSIRPGDLLTTASRAGHAMRASDPVAAFGAVLGKAMTALDQESGLVLVLVSLQ